MELLEKALEGIELTEDEEQLINWISTWDLLTVQRFTGIIKKCRNRPFVSSHVRTQNLYFREYRRKEHYERKKD